MKNKLFVFMLFLIVLMLLSGCESKKSPKDTVIKFSEALQKYDLNTAKSYFKNPDDFDTENYDDYINSNEKDNPFIEILKQCQGKLTFSITETSITDTKATVTAKYDYIDLSEPMKDAIKEYFSEAFTKAFSGEKVDDDYASEFFNEKFKAIKEYDHTESTVTFNLEMVDGNWIISEIPEDLYDVITCKMYSLFKGLSDSLKDSDLFSNTESDAEQ